VIPLAAIVLGILLVPATGGSFGVLRNARLRSAFLVPSALVLQALSSSEVFLGLVPNSTMAAVGLWGGGALLLSVFCWRNKRLHGMRIVAAGIALNALVIACNSGMPVGLDAVSELGSSAGALRAVESSALYNLQSEATRLVILADVLPVPGPSPVRAIVSIGDLMLFGGVTVTIVESSLRLHSPKVH